MKDIRFTFLNWEFKSHHLYGTEIIETTLIEKTIENLETVLNKYKTTKVFPLSGTFWAEESIILPDIKEFLVNSVKNCEVTGEQELLSYQKLLGPQMRHGPEILKEISGIAKGIIDGEGNYDHLMVLDEFLKHPYSGVSALDVRAIQEARKALACCKKKCDPYYGKQQYVSDFLEFLGIDTTGIPQETLERPLHIYEDDGMGYGAKNGEVLLLDEVKNINNEVRLWM